MIIMGLIIVAYIAHNLYCDYTVRETNQTKLSQTEQKMETTTNTKSAIDRMRKISYFYPCTFCDEFATFELVDTDGKTSPHFIFCDEHKEEFIKRSHRAQRAVIG